MRYIISSDGVVLGSITSGNINTDDLQSRGESIMEGDDIPVDQAVIVNGSIVQKEATPDDAYAEEQKLIYHQMYLNAMDAVKASGVSLPAHDAKIKETIS